MSNGPFFSIVIPTLNEEEYLPQLLQALGKQVYRNFETIVVDANSYDNTYQKAQAYRRSLPSLKIITTHKRSVSYQRNLGAKKASGVFLVFFDADVTVPANFLEKINKEIVGRKLTFVTTKLDSDKSMVTASIITEMTNIVFRLAKTIGKPSVPGFNIVVHADSFFNIDGFNERMTMSEDQDFALRMHGRGIPLEILEEPKLTMSLRRLHTEGKLQILYKILYSNIYFALKGPITKQIFEYQMGGHIHREKKKQTINLWELKTYLTGISRLENKIGEFLNE